MWFTGPEVLNLGASPSGGRYGISSWLGIFSQASYCWKNLEKNNSLEILFAWNAKIGIAISEKSSKLKPIWLGGHVGFLQGNVIMPGLFIGRSSHVSGDVYITEEKNVEIIEEIMLRDVYHWDMDPVWGIVQITCAPSNHRTRLVGVPNIESLQHNLFM